MRNLFAAFVSNTVFANVAVVIVLFVGAMAAMNMLRENNPAIVIPFISVTVPYPGADPEEVEEGITQKVAAVVDGLEGVKRYTTSSNEGFSQTLIEVYEDADPDIVRDRVRNVVDTIDSFPAEAEQPRVVREVETEEVISLAIWGDLPERQLKTLAEHVRRDLQELPELSQVEVLNAREYELSVEVPEETLRAYALTLSDVAEAIRRSSLNASAGTLRLEGEEIRLRTLGRRYEGPDFADVVVKALPEGDVVTLGQLATIDDTFVESERHVSFNGMPAVRVEVLKAPGEDSIAIADAVRAYVEERTASLPEGANITPFLDNTTFIDSQIRMLSMNGLLGLLLVLGILWLFLDTRLGTWVAMGIPTSLAGALVVLWLMGASLNQVSVVAMIIVMGIIVDDAIVVGEAIFVHRRMGKSGVEAAVDGVREVGLPVLASATTTIVANLPLAFVAGIFGQFVFQTPLVVITALLVSLVECLILLPAHLNHRTRMERGEPPRRPFAMLNRVHERQPRTLRRAPVHALSQAVHSLPLRHQLRGHRHRAGHGGPRGRRRRQVYDVARPRWRFHRGHGRVSSGHARVHRPRRRRADTPRPRRRRAPGQNRFGRAAHQERLHVDAFQLGWRGPPPRRHRGAGGPRSLRPRDQRHVGRSRGPYHGRHQADLLRQSRGRGWTGHRILVARPRPRRPARRGRRLEARLA